jgi:hypothetical protein
LIPVKLFKKTAVRHAAHERPRRSQIALPAARISRDAPGAKQQESAEYVIVKEGRRILAPAAPAANRFRERR